jgi:long-subunit fatty acid transport protein
MHLCQRNRTRSPFAGKKPAFLRRNNFLGGMRSVLMLCALAEMVLAETITIPTPKGPVEIDVAPVGPSGNLLSGSPPRSQAFLPPTMYSAPLPSGSGARALGMAGAFTALADDATAASWNPGGLTQLESKEFSYVFRFKDETQSHRSDDPSFRVGDDDYDALALNYLSLVYPFHVLDRNWVASINYQESYDFEQRFTAIPSSQKTSGKSSSQANIYEGTVTREYHTPDVDMTVRQHLTTESVSTLRQLMNQEVISSLDFEQSGVVDAVSPALAVDLTHRLALGVAVNFHRDGYWGSRGISSTTQARYSGYSTVRGELDAWNRTSGTYTYEGVAHFKPSGSIPFPYDLPFEGEGVVDPFVEHDVSHRSTQYRIEGSYEEENNYTDFFGWNTTWGVLWTPVAFMNVGLSFDLPWTADAVMTKRVRHQVTTYNSEGTRVLQEDRSDETLVKDVEFDFPLRWAVGTAMKWNNNFYSMLDVSRTHWSDFSFQVEDEPAVNPLNGEPHAESSLDDCWAIRLGSEYLLMFPSTEIPLRAGVGWEERPALDRPDQYWSLSLGTGFSVGREPVKCIVDVAYQYTWARDVMGSLVPGQESLETDTDIHEIYLSNIWHF